MSKVIVTPTVGRMVHYWPDKSEHIDHNEGQPLSGQIAAVNEDGTVNLQVLDSRGCARSQVRVTLIQDGDEKPTHTFAEWMPYQKGQAAKTEALEAAAKS